MPDQNPREEFIQGLKEAEKAAVELKQSIKGLNKQLDELNHILVTNGRKPLTLVRGYKP